jgi:hypothetical protein
MKLLKDTFVFVGTQKYQLLADVDVLAVDTPVDPIEPQVPPEPPAILP